MPVSAVLSDQNDFGIIRRMFGADRPGAAEIIVDDDDRGRAERATEGRAGVTDRDPGAERSVLPREAIEIRELVDARIVADRLSRISGKPREIAGNVSVLQRHE